MDTTDPPESTRMLRVHSDDLKKGMYVCQLDRPWLDSPFLLQGFPSGGAQRHGLDDPVAQARC